MHPGSKEMREGKDKNIRIVPQSDSEKLEQGIEELQGILGKFRDSVCFDSDRPDFFWMRQRNTIMQRLHGTKPLRHRRKLLWAPAAVAVLLCLFFFGETGKAPAPDLAAGYDQDLLVDVERALSRNYPDALAPAVLIIQEMEQKATGAAHP